MAKKSKSTATETPAVEITDEQIKQKLADSGGLLTREQARTVLETQRDHDAALADEE